jgi:hypothetical protein
MPPVRGLPAAGVAAGDNPGRLRSEAAFADRCASGAPVVPLLPPPPLTSYIGSATPR